MFIVAFAVVLLAFGLFIGNMFYNLALNPAARKNVLEAAPHSRIDTGAPDGEAAERMREMHQWAQDAEFEDLHITSGDNLRLHAYALEQPGDRWAILCHGYMNAAGHMKNAAYVFWKRGYSVLLPDARGHGKSEGGYVGMGWHERLDIIGWIEVITGRNPDAQIVLYGVSMGAATVMMASGEELPPNVRAVIEDCGYTSAWDEFEYQLGTLFKLPPFPFMHIASLIAKVRAGFWFREASALEQVKKSRTPTLFIHGDADTLVPPEMVYRLYDAAAGPKDILIAGGASHCMSANTLGAAYWEKVFEFTERSGKVLEKTNL